MGRKATGSVFARGEEIRVQFQWQGSRVSETLHGYSALNPAHMRQAHKSLAKIVLEVGNGTFDYAGTFPNSKRAAVARGTDFILFGDVMDSFLAKVKATLAQRTYNQYLNAGDEWKAWIGADLALHTLTPKRLSDIIYVERTWSGVARFNNALIPLRGALNLARASDPKLPDWLASIKNKDSEEGEPDPVTPADVKRILAYIRKHFDERCWAWYAFAFSTGLRPSEQCVLTHKDITAKVVRVVKAQDLDGSVKKTKTKGKREVDLSPLAREAVEVSKSYPNDTGEIFQNPWSGKPWKGNRSQHENVWVPTLAALDISPRRAYCTRHTFATTLLQNGAVVAYVSAQMGHTSPTMVEETYWDWIPDGDEGTNLAILQKAFA